MTAILLCPMVGYLMIRTVRDLVIGPRRGRLDFVVSLALVVILLVTALWR